VVPVGIPEEKFHPANSQLHAPGKPPPPGRETRCGIIALFGMKSVAFICSLLAAAVLAGCDTFYGISRFGSTQQIPKPDEVEAIIASIPEVKKVTWQFVSPGRSFSLYEGVQKAPDYYQFQIYGTETSCVLTIGEEKRKEVRLYYYRMNLPLTEAERVKIGKFMDRVYAALVRRFPQLPPPTELKDTTK